MSLFPDKDTVGRLKEAGRGYADALRQEDREAFLTMIEKCYAHAAAINAKGEPFPNEALLVSLVFSQYQMINWLVPKIAELSKQIQDLKTQNHQ
jgi:hypothetical protein